MFFCLAKAFWFFAQPSGLLLVLLLMGVALLQAGRHKASRHKTGRHLVAASALREWIGLVVYRASGRTSALFPGPS